MNNNIIYNARFEQKHDLESKWSSIPDFIPKAGEIIIYDSDEDNPEPRIKIGDGEKTISTLPFATITETELNNIISNLSANYITSGVLPIARGGTGQTTIVDTTYTTARYRASSLNATETTPTQNGVICWTYE